MASNAELRERKRKKNVTVNSSVNDLSKDLDHKTPAGGVSDYNDALSAFILLVLYTLQGIPMGLSSSIPFILQEKVGYKDQATFSLVSWPFSLKLLWAPIVDSVYVSSFGRRKSWLVPVQMLCSVFMVGGSWYINDLLGENESGIPHVNYLTMYFFVLYFTMATQDIAVDGWALTMLSPKNVSYASTCNTVGQTLGYFIAYVGFLALNDPKTCNSYLRSIPSERGLVDLPEFMAFWGYVMFITTLFIWFFKKERKEAHEDSIAIKDTYQQMWSVLRLPSIISYAVVLLTAKIAFAPIDAVASLKIVEYGLEKEKLAFMTPFIIPIGIISPVFLSKYTKGDDPLKLFMTGYPLRLLLGVLYAAIICITPIIMAHDEEYHFYYYIFMFTCVAVHSFVVNMMFVSNMSFFARISDPRIGGTYMTFLNTIANLGVKWPNSLSLAIVDSITTRECTVDDLDTVLTNDCSTTALKQSCREAGGQCVMVQDGFYIEVAIATVIGVVWILFFWKRLKKLESLSVNEWRISM